MTWYQYDMSDGWRRSGVLRVTRRKLLQQLVAVTGSLLGAGALAQLITSSSGGAERHAGRAIWIDAVHAGADPTGQTDASPYINDALRTAAGKVVLVPAGTYLLNHPILVPSASILLMDRGAIFIQNTYTSLQNVNTTLGGAGDSNIQVFGGTFQISPNYKSVHVYFSQVTNLRVSNMTILGTNTANFQALWLNNIYHAQIDHIYVDVYNSPGGGSNNGIWLAGGNNVAISNCVVRSGDDAYAFGSVATGEPFADTFNCTISNCHGESRRARVLDIEADGDTNVYGISANNLTGTVGAGGGCLTVANYSKGASTTHDVTISNCVLDASDALEGVVVDGASDVEIFNVILRGVLDRGRSSGRACFVAQTMGGMNTSVSNVRFAGCRGQTNSLGYGALQVSPGTGGSAAKIQFERCRVVGGAYGAALWGTSGPVTNCSIQSCEITASAIGHGVGADISSGVTRYLISESRFPNWRTALREG